MNKKKVNNSIAKQNINNHFLTIKMQIATKHGYFDFNLFNYECNCKISFMFGGYLYTQLKMGDEDKTSVFTNKQLDKLRNIHTMKYFATIKHSEIYPNMLI